MIRRRGRWPPSVQRAKASRPEDRYDDVQAMQADLRRYLDGLAVSAYAEPVTERLLRVVARYRVPIGLVAAYMIMRLALIACVPEDLVQDARTMVNSGHGG